jgi:hypothetical protein
MPEPGHKRNGPAPSAPRSVSPRHAPRESDLDTQVQEELSAEVVALSDAVLALLRDRGHVEASELTEEVVLEATETILFAAMNCAHIVVGSALRARADEGRRHPAAATFRRFASY